MHEKSVFFPNSSAGGAEPGGADMRDGPGDEAGGAGGRSALLLRSRKARSARGERCGASRESVTTAAFSSEQIHYFLGVVSEN